MPGTRSPVQKKTLGQIDRDWRFVGVVRPVEFLSFSGTPQNNQVLLNWSVQTGVEIDRFEIERSIDNINYTQVGTITDAVKLNEQQAFNFINNTEGINSDIIFYRLKVIAKTGGVKYSNILVVRLNKNKIAVSIAPNPVKEYVSVKFFVEKESEVTISLVDYTGKTVMLQKQKVAKGYNTTQLYGLVKYAAGTYTVLIFVNDEMAVQKFILIK